MAARKGILGVGMVAKAATLAGAKPKDAASITKALIPECGVSLEAVYSYRADLRRDGYEVSPTR